mmetsp:Transcript_36363/g.102727  ORF Transcript_36363/g.102727 Transcript_36363/m.102727 type:complete len:156 (+) Transcript_36363:195-662(+)
MIASRAVAAGALIASVMMFCLLPVTVGRTLQEDAADMAEADMESLRNLMELAVDSILEQQAAGTAAVSEGPTRRNLIEVALARAARERASRDAIASYNEEKRAKTKAVSDLRAANRVSKSTQDSQRATINKLEAAKRELERENRSLRSACLKATH